VSILVSICYANSVAQRLQILFGHEDGIGKTIFVPMIIHNFVSDRDHFDLEITVVHFFCKMVVCTINNINVLKFYD
jgi:hypothetical protein